MMHKSRTAPKKRIITVLLQNGGQKDSRNIALKNHMQYTFLLPAYVFSGSAFLFPALSTIRKTISDVEIPGV